MEQLGKKYYRKLLIEVVSHFETQPLPLFKSVNLIFSISRVCHSRKAKAETKRKIKFFFISLSHLVEAQT